MYRPGTVYLQLTLWPLYCLWLKSQRTDKPAALRIARHTRIEMEAKAKDSSPATHRLELRSEGQKLLLSVLHHFAPPRRLLQPQRLLPPANSR